MRAVVPVLVLTACHGLDRPEYDETCMAALLEPVVLDPSGVVTHWRVDSVDMPSTATQANQLGIDLDCDSQARPDNAMGQIFSIIYSQGESSDLDAEVNAMITAGRLTHLLSIQSLGLTDAEGVELTLRHGTGSEPYTVDEGRGRGTVRGAIREEELVLRGQQLPIGIALPSLDEVVILPIEGSRIEATVSPGRIEGRIGGAIPRDAWDLVAMPFIHRALLRAVERDCPDLGGGEPPCGCAPDTFGATLLRYLDEQPEPDGDCQLTFEEFRDNSLVSSLFAPDVDLFDEDGQFSPRTDGIKDSLSFGFGFTAVPTSVEEP